MIRSFVHSTAMTRARSSITLAGLIVIGTALCGSALTKLEHPYLFFKKSDIPTLKQRAQTPEGQALMKYLVDTLLPRGDHGFIDNGSEVNAHEHEEGYYAAGHALVYLLTGEQFHLDKCKERINQTFSRDFRWRTYGLAFTYDLVYEHIDAALRDRVHTFLKGKASYAGGLKSPKDHDGRICNVPAAGLAGMAILHDLTDQAQVLTTIENVKTSIAEWAKAGSGDKLWRNDWGGYADALWATLPFVEAYRNTMGTRAGTEVFDWAPVLSLYTNGRFQLEKGGFGVWCMGVAPKEYWPHIRWYFDQRGGIRLSSPWIAISALVNGLATPPADPTGKIPLVLADRLMGAAAFRKGWTGERNYHAFFDGKCVSETYPNSQGDFHLAGQGSIYAEGRIKLYAGAEFNLISHRFDARTQSYPNVFRFHKPDADSGTDIFPVKPAVLRYMSQSDNGSGVVSIHLDHFAEGNAHPSWSFSQQRPLLNGGANLGITHLRSFGVDYSEASGLPMLAVVADKISGAGNHLRWFQLNLRGASGGPSRSFVETKLDTKTWPANTLVEDAYVRAHVLGALSPTSIHPYPGNTITMEDVTNRVVVARMKVVVVSPADAKISVVPSGSNKGFFLISGSGDEYLTLFMVLRGAGPLPEVKITGSGLNAKVTIGNQNVSFDGTKVVFSHYAPTSVFDTRGRRIGQAGPIPTTSRSHSTFDLTGRLIAKSTMRNSGDRLCTGVFVNRLPGPEGAVRVVPQLGSGARN